MRTYLILAEPALLVYGCPAPSYLFIYIYLSCTRSLPLCALIHFSCLSVRSEREKVVEVGHILNMQNGNEVGRLVTTSSDRVL